jgi:hypothetical protein
MKDFDTIASENLSYLIEYKFDKIWLRANEVLSRMIQEINKDRTSSNSIDISQRLDREVDGKALRWKLEKIGGMKDTFTDGEKLLAFQKKITESLNYPSSDSRSLEALMRAKSETT